MTVNNEKLTRMAEQITANMNYGEDTEVIADKVADHINRFWDQRMIVAFKAHADRHRESLSKPLQAAVLKLD